MRGSSSAASRPIRHASASLSRQRLEGALLLLFLLLLQESHQKKGGAHADGGVGRDVLVRTENAHDERLLPHRMKDEAARPQRHEDQADALHFFSSFSSTNLRQ